MLSILLTGFIMQPNPIGQLFIVSAPSGGGKTSLVKNLVAKLDNIEVSISHTTRDQRAGENDGEHYFFVSLAKFNAMLANGKFIEHATVYGNLYGTSCAQIESRLNKGKDVVLDIDWQGAASIRRRYKNSVSIFILPPSLKVLQTRLTERGRDHEENIRLRMDEAQAEIKHFAEFDYLIINENFSEALESLSAIILAARVKTSIQTKRYQHLLSLLVG
ncbi:MAG: guanylate kinase [Gammaproteobacteria bacterium RIFCSPHIGHO2_12_FULL_41_15]|nr:MAG: guanylate kinase [Gammaproteobacteria bacterium RIFCSPHIGHO2_12_FULL_41_15]